MMPTTKAPTVTTSSVRTTWLERDDRSASLASTVSSCSARRSAPSDSIWPIRLEPSPPKALNASGAVARLGKRDDIDLNKVLEVVTRLYQILELLALVSGAEQSLGLLLPLVGFVDLVLVLPEEIGIGVDQVPAALRRIEPCRRARSRRSHQAGNGVVVDLPLNAPQRVEERERHPTEHDYQKQEQAVAAHDLPSQGQFHLLSMLDSVTLWPTSDNPDSTLTREDVRSQRPFAPFAMTALAGAGLAAYAFVEPHLFRLNRVVAEIPAGAPRLDVLHFSDSHMTAGRRSLRKWLERLPGLLERPPDLTLATGDLIEDDSGIEPIVEALAQLNGTMGSFYVFGSHDYYQSKFQAYTKYVTKKRPVNAPRAATDRLVEGLQVGRLGIGDQQHDIGDH